MTANVTQHVPLRSGKMLNGLSRRPFWSSICHLLARNRLAQLILCLLVVLILMPVFVHNYISNLIGDGPEAYDVGTAKHQGSDLDKLTSTDIRGQIEELRRIRASVNNELRDLESKRLGLQTEISNYKTQVEEFRMHQEELEKSIQQSKLNLDQLKMEESEWSDRYRPVIRAPAQVILSEKNTAKRVIDPPSSPQTCRMYSCFDLSRCSLLSGFPVYVYNLDAEMSAGWQLNEFIKSSVMKMLNKSPYLTQDADSACVFIALLGETLNDVSAEDLQSRLKKLSHWNGDGRNHVLLNLARSPPNFDLFAGVNTGRAIIVQSSFVENYFRPKFDIIIPPSVGASDGPVWKELLPLSPLRRKFMLSFSGQFNYPKNIVSTVNHQDSAQANVNSDQNFKSRKLNAAIGGGGSEHKTLASSLIDLEVLIVDQLKQITTSADHNVYVSFSCDKGERVGLIGEWQLCGSPVERADILKQSVFSIMLSPANFSVVSTTNFQIRLYESLRYGAVPVILGEYSELPFSEVLDWNKAAVIVPKARVTELYFLLRSFTDHDVAELKRTGRLFWETYFGTTESIMETVLAVLRTRLQIPALPMPETPSETSVTNFIPVPQHLDPEDETDEMLGPVEPPFPSPSYIHNFTQHLMFNGFNQAGDPFHLFPFTPFETVLPSDSKFKGSEFGYRPINKGEGGSGKEFSEALGGNHPREQFTMVMLTYERSEVLIKAITRLKGLPYLNKVIVVWNNPAPPSENLGWPDIEVPVVVVKMSKNSLNNRFLPFEAIETECVLSIDDDSHLRHDEIVFGFRVWREERDRIVGFPGRYHAWDLDHKAWLYNSNYSCEMSMVLTGAAFFHKYYAFLYSHVMPQVIREKVDEYMNCEDIAMNFLVSHVTRKPPVKVTSRWTFRCPGCPQTLALDSSHFEERHKCINFFSQVYGYMPLLYTQYRVDSILFKTRISHDKQKCFKYI